MAEFTTVQVINPGVLAEREEEIHPGKANCFQRKHSVIGPEDCLAYITVKSNAILDGGALAAPPVSTTCFLPHQLQWCRAGKIRDLRTANLFLGPTA